MKVNAYLEITMKIDDANRAAAAKFIRTIESRFWTPLTVRLQKNF